jgi:hypothetical protein
MCFLYLIPDCIGSFDGFGFRKYFHSKVVVIQVPPFPFWCDTSPQRICPGEFLLLGISKCDNQKKENSSEDF